MGIARVGSNPAVVASAPLAEWSKALRSGRSHHSMAQVRILQGAFSSFYHLVQRLGCQASSQDSRFEPGRSGP